MFPGIIVQALKLVTAVESWIPLPTPPLGESALSSGLIQIQTYNIYGSLSHTASAFTAYIETEIRRLREIAAVATRNQKEYTDFFELIESHRPLNAHERELFHVYKLMAEMGRWADDSARTWEQGLERVKSARGAKDDNSTVEFMEVNVDNGMGIFVL
ncbi:hypothetical protein DHEL01_v204132 [Diaporthe helianthi]|uniref:Uncharacterized protein n=1 Tax=Diaporthe helianthi TaxID=158607 RepID=A0A2P5I4S7_DIAHE|nr:hypothetical protein DHEL01_v204132 [Diaporthe helianthi]